MKHYIILSVDGLNRKNVYTEYDSTHTPEHEQSVWATRYGYDMDECPVYKRDDGYVIEI